MLAHIKKVFYICNYNNMYIHTIHVPTFSPCPLDYRYPYHRVGSADPEMEGGGRGRSRNGENNTQRK